MKISINRYMFFIFVCLACVMAGGCGKDTISLSEDTDIVSEDTSSETAISGDQEPDGNQAPDGTSAILAGESGKIYVYVCGAVAAPGVYELDEGSRVNDALVAAGGFSEDADRNVVNLAEEAADEQRIYFPVQGENLSQKWAGEDLDNAADSGEYAGLININKADVSELMELPGIGETRAGQIVEYRRTYGGFSTKEDLKNVSGIGDSIYRKLESYITVD